MTNDRKPGTGTPARDMTTYAATLTGNFPAFISLDRETRAAVETACAAFHLTRQPQTLRIWAMRDSGPIRAFRVHGRLMWPTAKLRELCGVA